MSRPRPSAMLALDLAPDALPSARCPHCGAGCPLELPAVDGASAYCCSTCNKRWSAPRAQQQGLSLVTADDGFRLT